MTNLTDILFFKSKTLRKKLILNCEHSEYSDIYSRILNVACCLKRKNLQKGSPILLCSENNLFFIIAYFGIIKSGHICVPLDTKYSQYHYRYIINQTNANIAFTHPKFASKFQKINIDLIQDVPTVLDPVEDFETPSSPNETAIILYTSGSTGDPKGVELSHRNILANTGSIVKYLLLSQDEIHAVVLPFFYSYGLSILHTHVQLGASLVLNNQFIFPQTVIEDIQSYNCTGFSGVPSTYQILCRMCNFLQSNLPSLRYFTQAGGKLSTSIIKTISSAFPEIKFFTMYGATEATARLSYLDPKFLCEHIGSIGKAIPGVTLKIMDRQGNELSPGVMGEIWARGENIMKGYYRDAKLTNETIEDGWLKTGDLAKMDEDGFIYIIDREKDFIKSAGCRISAKEIEDVIMQDERILETAVISVPDEMLGEAIEVFYVAKNSDINIENDDLLEFCQKHLPNHKIPKYFNKIKVIPKNSSGKILKNKLRE